VCFAEASMTTFPAMTITIDPRINCNNGGCKFLIEEVLSKYV
jgi:hypothetical protein